MLTGIRQLGKRGVMPVTVAAFVLQLFFHSATERMPIPGRFLSSSIRHPEML
jgi:hypothetical protein